MTGEGRVLPSLPGTYALLLELPGVTRLDVGGLGRLTFDAPVYLYAGSAFGPGGLAARLAHHLGRAARPHWHIDRLRRVARVSQVWMTTDERRLECAWSKAAASMRSARTVEGFGASDCRCVSHLVALPRAPSGSTFRRHLRGLAPRCGPIRRLTVARPFEE